MSLTHINPEGMFRSPYFSQGVLIEGPGRLLVVGGQNGVDANGELVSDDLAGQTVQAMKNVLAVLNAAGSGPKHVAKLNIHLATGQDANAGYAAAAEVWGPVPTAITVLQVGFARPGVLVEIDALAQVPEQRTPSS